MSLSNNYVPTKTLGNGVTTIFTGTWNPVSLSFIEVFLESVATGVQTPVVSGITKEFTTTGGFRVTFVTAPTSASYVVIGRDTTQDQLVPYKTSKGFDGTNTETSFDKLTAMAQELQDQVNRSLKFPLGSSFVGNISEAPEDGALLAWSGTSGTVVNADITVEDIEAIPELVEEARQYALAAQEAAVDAGQITGAVLVPPAGSTLTPSRSLANLLSNSGRVFHSKDFSGIDHTGVLDSLSGVQKLLNKGGDPDEHTIIFLDAGTLNIGNNVPQMSAIVGGLTITSIVYNNVTNQVRVNFNNASSLSSATVTTGLATGSSFLTIEGAANDQNNGRFTMLSWSNTTNDKHIIISATRSDATLNETGLSLTTSSNRIRVAGMEPLYIRDNTTIFINCNMTHHINSGLQHLMCCYNVSDDAGITTYDIHVDMTNGGCVVFPNEGTPSPSKKGIAYTYAQRFSMRGYRSTGNDRGSFDFQIRNCSYGHIWGSTQQSGNSTGEDGVHAIKTCRYVTISDLVIESGDDSLSFTQESSANPYIIEHITVTNCVLRTSNNSSFKCFLDSTAAGGGAKIRNINVNNCHFGVHNNSGVGTLLRLSSVTGQEEGVTDITIDNCTTDNVGDGTGALTSTSIRFDYVSRCRISNSQIVNCVRNSVIMNGGVGNSLVDNTFAHPAPQTSVHDETGLAISGITNVSGTSYTVQFDGSPDLAAWAASSTFSTLTIPSGTVNFNGTWATGTVNNTSKTVIITTSSNITGAGFDETGLSVTGAYGRKQPAEMISIAGGVGHKVKGNDFVGSYNDANGRVIAAINAVLVKTDSATAQVPSYIDVSDNDFTGFKVSGIVFLQNGQYLEVNDNTAHNNTAVNFILEGSGTTAPNRFFRNDEYGNVRTPISYNFNKATSVHRNNTGSNSDIVRGTATLAAAATTVVINIANHYTAPTGFDGPWTQGFNAADPNPLDLRIVANGSWGTTDSYYVTYNSGTRNMTITADAVSGVDVPLLLELATY